MEKARPADQKGLRGGGEESTGTEHRAGISRGTLGHWGIVEMILEEWEGTSESQCSVCSRSLSSTV